MAKKKKIKSNGLPYTKEEIKCFIDQESISDLTYETAEAYSKIHFNKTGVKRSSGALYMAYWRYKKGSYNHLL